MDLPVFAHPPRRRALVRLGLGALGSLVLVALALSRPGAAPQTGSDGPSWPPAPDLARIRYVATIETPQDIGAGPSWFGRFVRFVAGSRPQPRLLRPHGVTTDSAGRLIVADPEQRMVHVFDQERKRYSYLEPAPFASPVGVAVGRDDAIYVTDSARRAVFVYGRDGKLRATLGVRNGEPIFVRPTGIAVGPDGLVYVVDTVACTVTALEPDGRVAFTFGRRGGGPGEFNFPTHVTMGGDGLLYVVDSLNARIQVHGRDGLFVRSFGRRGNGSGDLDKPKGISLDPDGHVYVVESLHDVVQIFDEQGRLLLVVGSSGTGPGQFALPAGVHIDRSGRVYVADSLNGRIEVFQYLRRADAN